MERMSYRRWGAAIVAFAMAFVAGCGSDTDPARLVLADRDDAETASADVEEPSSPATIAQTNATTPAAASSERAADESNVSAAVVGWWLFPFDTSLGQAGLPIRYLTDPLRTDVIDLAQTRVEAGQIQRSRGNPLIRITDLTIDADAGTAVAGICAAADQEVVLADTASVLSADQEDRSYLGRVNIVRVDGEWLVSEFASSLATGSPQPCENAAALLPTTSTVPGTPDDAETTTTLSELVIAKAAIEGLVLTWHTYPIDTSRGEIGLPLEHLTDALYDQTVMVSDDRTARGEIHRSRGEGLIRVLGITVDLATGTAEISICGLAEGEIVDAATNEVLAVDPDVPSMGQLRARTVDGEWKLSEFFPALEGGEPVLCEV